MLTDILEISNLIFSALFALEMVLKLIAFGFIGYVSNGFNVFDGFIVTLRLVTQLLEQKQTEHYELQLMKTKL